MILAAFLFIKRVKDIVTVSPLYSFSDNDIKADELSIGFIGLDLIPKEIEVYEITGPFFFGLVDSLKEALLNFEF